MFRHEIRELLGCTVLRPVSIRSGFSGLAHRLDEADLVVDVHCSWAFHTALDHLAEAKVLIWVAILPSLIAVDVRV